jgi:hypothetical protein
MKELAGSGGSTPNKEEMKMYSARIKTVLLVAVTIGLMGLSAASARPVSSGGTIPPTPRPGGNYQPVTLPPGFSYHQTWSENLGGWMQPINLPFLIFLGDVVLIENPNVDLTRDIPPGDPNYPNARNNPKNWSDVLHIDNSPRGTFFSDLDTPPPAEANQPWEVDFTKGLPPFFVNANYPPTAVAPSVYLFENGGTVAYQPIPGVDIVFLLISDAVE